MRYLTGDNLVYVDRPCWANVHVKCTQGTMAGWDDGNSLTQNNIHNYDCVVWQHSVHCKWFKTQQAYMDSSEFPVKKKKKTIYMHSHMTRQYLSYLVIEHTQIAAKTVSLSKSRKQNQNKTKKQGENMNLCRRRTKDNDDKPQIQWRT